MNANNLHKLSPNATVKLTFHLRIGLTPVWWCTFASSVSQLRLPLEGSLWWCYRFTGCPVPVNRFKTITLHISHGGFYSKLHKWWGKFLRAPSLLGLLFAKYNKLLFLFHCDHHMGSSWSSTTTKMQKANSTILEPALSLSLSFPIRKVLSVSSLTSYVSSPRRGIWYSHFLDPVW